MSIVKLPLGLGSFCGSSRHIGAVLFAKNYSMYGPEWIDPIADPKYYKDNPPADGDAMSLKKIKAAPNDHTYSSFYDETLHKFRKLILKQGKGVAADAILKDTLTLIKFAQLKKYHAASEEEKPHIEINPLKVFHEGLGNIKPVVNVESLRRGSQVYQIPYPLDDKDQFFIASSWLLAHIKRKVTRAGSASGKPNTKAGLRLSQEILRAYQNQGDLVQKKKELHKLAESKRAYAHFRWRK